MVKLKVRSQLVPEDAYVVSDFSPMVAKFLHMPNNGLRIVNAYEIRGFFWQFRVHGVRLFRFPDGVFRGVVDGSFGGSIGGSGGMVVGGSFTGSMGSS